MGRLPLRIGDAVPGIVHGAQVTQPILPQAPEGGKEWGGSRRRGEPETRRARGGRGAGPQGRPGGARATARATPERGSGGLGLLEFDTEHGRIAISEDVIAGIAGAALAGCEGVVGTVPRGWRQGLAGLLGTEAHGRGVEVAAAEGGGLEVTVRIVVAYGVPIPEVARTVMRRVGEAVRRAVGEDRVRVHVHVAGVRVPAGALPGAGTGPGTSGQVPGPGGEGRRRPAADQGPGSEGLGAGRERFPERG